MASHRRLADTLSNEIKKAEKRGRAAASDPTATPLRPRTRSQGLAPSPRDDDETPAEAEVFSDGSTSANESFNTPTNQSFVEEEEETEMPQTPRTPPPATTAPPVINIVPPPVVTTAAIVVTTAAVTTAAVTHTTASVAAPSIMSTGRGASPHSSSSFNGTMASDAQFAPLVANHGSAVRSTDRAVRKLEDAMNELTDAISVASSPAEVSAGLKRVKDYLAVAKTALTHMIDAAEGDNTLTAADRDGMVATVDARLLFAERESYRIMSLAEEFLKRLEQDRTDARQRSMGAKIPELPLRKFNGSGIRLSEFMEAFDANVGRKPNLTDANKLEYLIGCCTGEAHQLISQFRSTDANYAKARAALKKRFGRKDVIIEQVYGEIEALSSKNKSPKASRELLDRLRGHLTTLENHDVKMTDGKEAAPVIASLKTKMNKEAVVAWLRWCSRQPWDGTRLPTMQEFVEFMDGELTTLLRYEHDAEGKNPRPPSNPPSRGGFGGGGAMAGRRGGFRRGRGGRDAAAAATPRESTALTTTTTKAPAPKKKAPAPGQGKITKKPPSNTCVYCSSTAHAAANCPKARNLTPRERVVQLKNACFRCLSVLHPRRNCPLMKRSCGIDNCREDHHPFLHGGFMKPT
jgi:hypothetical protein